MTEAPPILKLREWSRAEPPPLGTEPRLSGLELSPADRELVAELREHSKFRVEELRHGLQVVTDSHIGTVTLSQLRIVVEPKLDLGVVLRMVSRAFQLDDYVLAASLGDVRAEDRGVTDLLGLSLLGAVQEVVRGGLLPRYLEQFEELASPRGRIVFNRLAREPGQLALPCNHDDLTTDHLLNQVLEAGLRLGAQVMGSTGLRSDLGRAAGRFFPDLTRTRLDRAALRRARSLLDRRTNHYRTAIALVDLIYECGRIGRYECPGGTSVSSFLLDMNRVFERFVAQLLREQAVHDVEVAFQENWDDAFCYVENPSGWQSPRLRADVVVRRRGRTVAVADMKYKDRQRYPPDTSELFQLAAYGLAYDLPPPRVVHMFYPLERGAPELPAVVHFTPQGGGPSVCIRIVGVPIEDLVESENACWWPFEPALRA